MTSSRRFTCLANWLLKDRLRTRIRYRDQKIKFGDNNGLAKLAKETVGSLGVRSASCIGRNHAAVDNDDDDDDGDNDDGLADGVL